MSTNFKSWLADVIHNLKWVKIAVKIQVKLSVRMIIYLCISLFLETGNFRVVRFSRICDLGLFREVYNSRIISILMIVAL